MVLTRCPQTSAFYSLSKILKVYLVFFLDLILILIKDELNSVESYLTFDFGDKVNFEIIF